MKPVYIYSLTSNGFAFYVGQTSNTKQREANHRTIRRGFSFDFKILRSCSAEESDRIENQVITSLKKRNQCPWNKRVLKMKPSKTCRFNAEMEDELYFRLKSKLAIDGISLTNWLKREIKIEMES